MATPAEVEAIARTTGVRAAELAELAAADGIEIREPDPLPSAAPYPAYRKVRESLEVLGRRHLADFLFGARLTGPIRVLDGFAVPGGGPRPDGDAVAAASAEWARRSRDTTTTHADTVLAALRSGADLPALLLFDIADRLRERLRQRASERALLRYAAEELGVEQGDARRLVFAVVRETDPGGGLPGRLRALLDAGDVHAAAGLADAARVPHPPPAPSRPRSRCSPPRPGTASAPRCACARPRPPSPTPTAPTACSPTRCASSGTCRAPPPTSGACRRARSRRCTSTWTARRSGCPGRIRRPRGARWSTTSCGGRAGRRATCATARPSAGRWTPVPRSTCRCTTGSSRCGARPRRRRRWRGRWSCGPIRARSS
ncbi:hypothetical protein ACFQY7_21140 [Actinomadura luteofluorescens]|uniref:hypothetical protein n=1 Tax=Actinomadura luteofluorescens TaxID=46163 RepID=UPI003628CFCD